MSATSPTCTDSDPELYELYARAVVRCSFYPFESYVDSPQEASMYEAEIAGQWHILHPTIPDFSTLNLFEPANSITIFCRFHDSPRFNHIQVELWERLLHSLTYLLSFKDLFDLNSLVQRPVVPCLDRTLLAMTTKHIEIEDDSGNLAYRETSCPGCHITWLCSNEWWVCVKGLFVAAAVTKDDTLVAWIKNVIDARCSKRYSPEYCQVLPEDEGDSPWMWSFEQGTVYETACAAATAILAEIQNQEHWGIPKM